MPELSSIQPTTFSIHIFDASISEARYIFRVLQMDRSLFIYIGDADVESFNEMAVAMPMQNGDVVSTTVIGPLLGCDSKEFALKVSKRLKKQVYISCNVAADRMVRPMLEKRLSDEIKSHPECF